MLLLSLSEWFVIPCSKCDSCKGLPLLSEPSGSCWLKVQVTGRPGTEGQFLPLNCIFYHELQIRVSANESQCV